MDKDKMLPAKQYKRRFDVTEIDKDDLEAVLDMGVASLRGQKPKYPETPIFRTCTNIYI